MKKEKYLAQLNEEQLYKLMLKMFSNLVDLNIENPVAPIDWYNPDTDEWFEGKCRYVDKSTLFIEKDKWDELILKDKSFYVNSTLTGIYMWNIQEIEEPVWRNTVMFKSQQFTGKGEKVLKLVGDLPISKALQIDHLLFYQD